MGLGPRQYHGIKIEHFRGQAWKPAKRQKKDHGWDPAIKQSCNNVYCQNKKRRNHLPFLSRLYSSSFYPLVTPLLPWGSRRLAVALVTPPNICPHLCRALLFRCHIGQTTNSEQCQKLDPETARAVWWKWCHYIYGCPIRQRCHKVFFSFYFLLAKSVNVKSEKSHAMVSNDLSSTQIQDVVHTSKAIKVKTSSTCQTKTLLLELGLL